jgi:hypothetical protein
LPAQSCPRPQRRIHGLARVRAFPELWPWHGHSPRCCTHRSRGRSELGLSSSDQAWEAKGSPAPLPGAGWVKTVRRPRGRRPAGPAAAVPTRRRAAWNSGRACPRASFCSLSAARPGRHSRPSTMPETLVADRATGRRRQGHMAVPHATAPPEGGVAQGRAGRRRLARSAPLASPQRSMMSGRRSRWRLAGRMCLDTRAANSGCPIALPAAPPSPRRGRCWRRFRTNPPRCGEPVVHQRAVVPDLLKGRVVRVRYNACTAWPATEGASSPATP